MTGNRSERSPLAPRLRYASLALAICIGATALATFSTRHHTAFDWSADARHSLSAASIAALAVVTGPLAATVYLPDKHPAREQAKGLVARYQRHRRDFSLRFVDPASAPDTVRAQGIKDGELLLSAMGRTERLRTYTEQAMTNALARLARGGEQWVVFIAGHGERSPTRRANFDVSAWAEVLENRGLQVQELNLAKHPAIPDNTLLTVIASPQLAYLPGELRIVTDYLARGGNLLWLTEPDAPAEFNALAAAIGVEALPATVIDPVTQALGIDNPAISVITGYADHPALAGFRSASLLPYATPVHERPGGDWQATRLFESGEKAWGETDPLTGNVAFDDTRDYPGPLPLAIALTRKAARPGAAPEQRIVAVGDGDFLSNMYLGNGGNQDLGTRLVEWLAANDALIAIDTRAAPDTNLELARWQQAVIGFGFLFVLPGAFALNGMLIWWRRRRA